MDSIRLGILGPGRIVRRVMKDFHKAQGIRLTAVASRSLARAEEAAREYGAAYAFGSYEEMAACSEVDLVYVATPHNFHCGQAILMMEHGKHVICEKPIAVSRAETERMAACARANGVFLMEAMWTRCFPASKRMKAMIEEGTIGDVRHIYGVFSMSLDDPDPEDRLLNPALAGGSLLDVGVYPLMAATNLLGWNPARVQCLSRLTQTQVDAGISVQLQYDSGATVQIMSALDTYAPDQLFVCGTKGCITVDQFWHPTAFTVIPRDGGEPVRYAFDPEDEGYHHEFTEAARCIRGGLCESPLVTNEESIAVSGIMEQLRHEAGVYYPGECRP